MSTSVLSAEHTASLEREQAGQVEEQEADDRIVGEALVFWENGQSRKLDALVDELERHFTTVTIVTCERQRKGRMLIGGDVVADARIANAKFLAFPPRLELAGNHQPVLVFLRFQHRLMPHRRNTSKLWCSYVQYSRDANIQQLRQSVRDAISKDERTTLTAFVTPA